ncbi:MAG: tetratricopeptide repeat protein [Chloroflexi bacterium]|nr:tetratricopeptide repeat protein [Chloroflexota bacterium]
MAPIGLSEYLEEAKDRLRQGRAQESVAICRHILGFYPKYWAAYRLLGEVALERDDLQQAAELFRRVLSVDPEDIASYLALAVIYDEAGSLDEALWHLERAFELNPSNPEIRRELRRLYGRRDGQEPGRIKLTPAALGRLYLKGRLYDRAIAELKPLADTAPERIELKLALAEALWRDGRHWEAADACQWILEELPHSLKAILILAQIWAKAEQPVESQQLLRRAQEIDPEKTLTSSLLGEDSPLQPSRVLIPRIGEAIPEDLAALRPQPVFPLEVPLPQPRPIEIPIVTPLEELESREGAEPVYQGSPSEETPALEEAPGLEQIPPLEEVPAKEVPPMAEEVPLVAEGVASQAEPIPSGGGRAAFEEAPPMQEEVPLLAEEIASQPDPIPRGEEPTWLRALEELESESPTTEAEPPPTPEAAPSWLEALERSTAPAEPPLEAAELPSQGADWLGQLEEPALSGPPEALERAAPEGTPPMAEATPTEEITPTVEHAPPGEALPSAEYPPGSLEALESRLASDPQDHAARLAAARLLREGGQLAEALAHYQRLVHVPGSVPAEVMTDLAEMVEGHPDNLLAPQLLGDAYLKEGRLREGLEMYRRLRSVLRPGREQL